MTALTTANCVTLHDVWKRFDQDWVLRELTLAFPAGETTAVVGESGSGKSTLLQLVNGVYRPDRGEVRVFDEPLPARELAEFRRTIGYAVQGAGLFPHLTVRDNVTLVARLLGWSAGAREQRYREVLDLMGLETALDDRHPYDLSGGQQQRVGLCRALMVRPKLLLLDEPFSAVDPITRRGIHAQFLRMRQRERVSTVLVTHDMREAVKLASHLVILKDGAMIQHGPVPAVLAAPGHPYVADLLREQLE